MGMLMSCMSGGLCMHVLLLLMGAVRVRGGRASTVHSVGDFRLLMARGMIQINKRGGIEGAEERRHRPLFQT